MGFQGAPRGPPSMRAVAIVIFVIQVITLGVARFILARVIAISDRLR